MDHILAADIGGTHSRFGVFGIDEQGLPHLVESVWLTTHDAADFDTLLSMLPETVLAPLLPLVRFAVFAIPGAVLEGVVGLPPNIKWNIDLRTEGGMFPKRVLINDFAAQAYACATSAVDDALEIQSGTGEHGGTFAVIGAGTGLGCSSLTRLADGSTLAFESEGGHMGFPFVGKAESEYEEFVRRKIGRPFCDGDTIVTGRGLAFLHEFLTGNEMKPAEVAASIGPDCETRKWYSRFYGRVARNWVLATLGWRGLFICGGVAAKNPHFVTSPEFIQEFNTFPEYEHILKTVPVRLNMNEASGLYGAALCGAQLR